MIPEKDLRKMIGDKEYYLKINRTGKYPFNWVALFFPFIWMLYRKMYFYAFSLLFIDTLISYLRIGSFEIGTLFFEFFSLLCMKMALYVFSLPFMDALIAFYYTGLFSYKSYFASFLLRGFIAILLGFFGNRIYLSFLKSKYQKNEDINLRPVSIWKFLKSIVGIFFLLFVITLIMVGLIMEPSVIRAFLQNIFT